MNQLEQPYPVDGGRPLVSILIVTWNRREEVTRSVASALAQTYEPKEVVVVDNASTDGTAQMLLAKYPGIKLIGAPRNIGCPAGRNLGFQHCSGRYIYMLDDDGWLKEDAVAISVRRAETSPAIAVVMSQLEMRDVGRVAVNQDNRRTRPAGYCADFSGGCSLIRREALLSAGVFPEDFVRQGEEADLALRLFEAGYHIYFEPAAVMFHTMSPLGRDQRAILFYTLRNANKTALRLWPMPWCLLRPLVNLAHAVRHACFSGHFSMPWLVLKELVAELRSLPRRRRPISRQTFRLFKRLQIEPTVEPPVHPRVPASPPTKLLCSNPDPLRS